jgi:hypothetical protein
LALATGVESTDELSRQVLSLGGRAAVACRQQLAAGSKRLRY